MQDYIGLSFIYALVPSFIAFRGLFYIGRHFGRLEFSSIFGTVYVLENDFQFTG